MKPLVECCGEPPLFESVHYTTVSCRKCGNRVKRMWWRSAAAVWNRLARRPSAMVRSRATP